MNKIYGENTNNLSEGQTINESNGHNIEDKFVDELCNQITEILGINYQDRRTFHLVLKKAIGKDIDSVNNYDGLLQQHGAYVLDKSSKRLIDELELGDVKVNHEYAAHAKFADIVKAIKTKLDESSIKVKELGTEEFAEKLLERYGPEVIFKLAQLLIKIVNDDVNLGIAQSMEDISKPMAIDYRDDKVRQKEQVTHKKTDNPPNIMHMVASYKTRIEELQGLDAITLADAVTITTEVNTLKGVVANLSSWIVHNY
jgi:hypothetical protein